MTDRNDVADWWRTAIIDMEPGRIHLRGHPVQELIGTTGFAQMIWLMVMGERIDGPRAALFEAALVAAVDHGPQAPSIAGRAHGGDLRRRAAIGHGDRAEHAGQRAWRRGRAGGGALPTSPDSRARHAGANA